MTISTVFVLIACILFFLAAFGVPSSRVSLGWLGAGFFALAHLIGGIVIRG